jgi:hypothetical protein
LNDKKLCPLTTPPRINEAAQVSKVKGIVVPNNVLMDQIEANGTNQMTSAIKPTIRAIFMGTFQSL